MIVRSVSMQWQILLYYLDAFGFSSVLTALLLLMSVQEGSRLVQMSVLEGLQPLLMPVLMLEQAGGDLWDFLLNFLYERIKKNQL